MSLPIAAKYPKTINVADEIYQVKIVGRIPGYGKECRGLCICDADKKIIYIQKNQSPRGLFRTFIHELLHAIECEYSVSIKHKRIYVLEVALEALFTDNF